MTKVILNSLFAIYICVMILIKSKYFSGLKLDKDEPGNEARVKEFLLKLPPETEITITTRFGIEIETLRIEDLYSK